MAVLLAILTAAALYNAAHLTALADPDIWWHLRAGTWTLQNHAVPHDGLFSQSSSLPWVDSNWGFDIMTAVAYRAFALRGLPFSLMVFQVAIAAALLLLARTTGKIFWRAALLAVIGQYCISVLEPQSRLVSIFFFALELALLLHARRTGRIQSLYWLPLLFLVWANFDRQFAYGLLAFALFCAASFVEQVGPQLGSVNSETARRKNLASVAVAFAACLLATLLTPYTYHLYEVIWRSATSTATDRYFSELHSMRFRQPQDYLLMLLAMTALLVLGRRRSRDLFQISLLVLCALISFRLQRDSWLVVLAAVGIIADMFPLDDPELAKTARGARWEKPLTVAMTVIILAIGGFRLPSDPAALMAKVQESFPVRASDYIRQNRLPPPLFNTYKWGGFLVWYLPEYPVVIDGRVGLYPDADTLSYFRLTDAEIPLESHPGFARAQTFLLESSSPIGQALAALPGFRIVYRDDMACVLVRRN